MKELLKAFEINNLITLCIFHHKQAEQGLISKQELLDLINKYRNNNSNNDVLML